MLEEEARRRSDKTFVLCSAERLGFKDSAFDAAFTVTTLEFLDDYQEALKEISRVTKQHGKILVMMLNSKSEYFKEEIKKPENYFRRIKHTNPKEIKNHTAKYYAIIKEENFLGVRKRRIFDTNDERYAALRLAVGMKR